MEDDVIEEARAWKRDLGIEGRPSGSGMGTIKDALEVIQRVAEKGKQRYAEIKAEIDAKQEGCTAMVNTMTQAEAVEVAGCTGLTGFIRAYGVSEGCSRKSLDCWAGRRQYIQGAESYLRGLEMGPNYAGAHFFSSGFIWDSLSKAAYKFANEPHLLAGGESLILGGSTGPGKTFAALAIASHARMKLGWETILFQEASGLLDWSSRHEGLMDKARTCKLLIIDDLGTEKNNDAGKNNSLYRVINRRLEIGYPTVITCNMNEGDFFARYNEERLIDRLRTYKMMFTNLPSKRNKAPESR